ncbi:NAD(P)-binding protein [Setomelanomma holmii]|uniref:NAD(P)-binding protein n=1 Tax=Setomelanomma holmii TaxID=210430 RepID=A0A9P4LLH8_9PLEO|nr:NAD(P)-binding protein [Setomelanomma holmii]
MSVVKPDNLVLVTGANGYIGGVTVQKFLEAGFRVRETVRDPSKHEWKLSHYGSNFSLIEIPNMSAPGAFAEAVKDASGITHIAAPLQEGYHPDPNVVLPKALRCALELLEAAANEPSVKSVIYTSSQAAAITPKPGVSYHITADTWNEESKSAWTAPVEPNFARGTLNYMCSKTETEQKCFKWVEEHKSSFTFNTVLPNFTWGLTTRPDMTGFMSSAAILKVLWNGSAVPATFFPPMWFGDVEDVALLHRIFAMAGPYTYTGILNIFKKTCPDRKFLDKVDNERANELLKRLGKANGFSTLEETIKKWITQMLEEEKAAK